MACEWVWHESGCGMRVGVACEWVLRLTGNLEWAASEGMCKVGVHLLQ